jgi:hypothetical protein
MSSKPLQTKTIVDPDLVDVLINFKQDIFSSLNCVKVGRIISFDGTKKTAKVQILFKRTLLDGTVQSLQPIVDVPVFTLQGGGASFQMPIAAGDQCILLFSDRRLDEWMQNGAEAVPGDGRMHDLSDGIALVGINAQNSTLPSYPTNKVLVSYQGSRLEISATGAKLVSTGTAEIDLDTLVGIKNGATSLKLLLNNFIVLLEGLTVQDPISGPIPLTAASIALLEAYKAIFATLLE